MCTGKETNMTNRIEREIVLPAPVAEVWRALTDSEGLSEWLAEEVPLDLQPGGEARFTSGDQVKTGWIEEVSPPRPDGSGNGRLAFWWALDDEPASRVCFSVTGLPDGATRVRVIETRPLEVLDLVGIPLRGQTGSTFGPALIAA
jgi:uncharacterized protein YndB with AHSA1/START domain